MLVSLWSNQTTAIMTQGGFTIGASRGTCPGASTCERFPQEIIHLSKKKKELRDLQLLLAHGGQVTFLK